MEAGVAIAIFLSFETTAAVCSQVTWSVMSSFQVVPKQLIRVGGRNVD
jgi:hypothetical protein